MSNLVLIAVLALGDTVWLGLMGLCATFLTVIVAPYMVFKLHKLEKSINGMKEEQIATSKSAGFSEGVEAQRVEAGKSPKPIQQ